MELRKKSWVSVVLFNLCIVAFLGVLLRTKMLFPIESLDFRNVLLAHFHFAINGWITLTLLILMVFYLLPENLNSKPIYNYLYISIIGATYGMALFFLFCGNNAWSSVFIGIFIISVFVFIGVFTIDLFKTTTTMTVKLLCIGALVSLILSCVGPLTLIGYKIAARNMNVLVFRDTSYTYLHFQYNAFFPMVIFALLFNEFDKIVQTGELQKKMYKSAISLLITVIPTLFLSYLWHYPNIPVRIVSGIGCISMFVFTYYLLQTLKAAMCCIKPLDRHVRILGKLSIISLIIKVFMQMGTIIPWVGIVVFGNRPIIIGYLHLVMLGFTTLFLLAFFLHQNLLNLKNKFTVFAVWVFTTGVIANEVLLMLQGVTQICMMFHPVYLWVLWIAVLWILIGTILILSAQLKRTV